jgi:hypothetical protein
MLQDPLRALAVFDYQDGIYAIAFESMGPNYLSYFGKEYKQISSREAARRGGPSRETLHSLDEIKRVPGSRNEDEQRTLLGERAMPIRNGMQRVF